MTNIAVVGSRGFTDATIIQRAIFRMVQKYGVADLTIVSGGARGADLIGEHTAKDMGLPTIIHLPDWTKYGKSAGFRRNDFIVRDADVVLAFYAPGERSKGTKNTVASAMLAGKEVHVYHEGAWESHPRASEEARTDARGVLEPAPWVGENDTEFD